MGPLSGIKIIELAGIGPGPFCGMLLADMGAEVIRVERTQAVAAAASGRAVGIDLLTRGRRSIGVDLKHPDGIETVLALVAGADGLIEGFRPGVTERLGVGPDACLSRNPALVYGRMTGWGQDGPYAHMAGHDINYIALSGALAHIGRKGEAPAWCWRSVWSVGSSAPARPVVVRSSTPRWSTAPRCSPPSSIR
jgi:alpha-methylacyl-CoA racemase